MKTNTRKTAVRSAPQFVITPEKFKEEMEYIYKVQEFINSTREKLNHLKRLGAVTNVDELRKLYS